MKGRALSDWKAEDFEVPLHAQYTNTNQTSPEVIYGKSGAEKVHFDLEAGNGEELEDEPSDPADKVMRRMTTKEVLEQLQEKQAAQERELTRLEREEDEYVSRIERLKEEA